MSVATVDRLLFQERHPQGRGLSTTKRGSLLKGSLHETEYEPLNGSSAKFCPVLQVANIVGANLICDFKVRLSDILTPRTCRMNH